MKIKIPKNTQVKIKKFFERKENLIQLVKEH